MSVFRLGGVLDERCRDRMVHRRIGADDEDDLGIGDIAHLIRHRPRVDAFHQRGHARGVAEAGAVVHVVGSEPGAHQFLK